MCSIEYLHTYVHYIVLRMNEGEIVLWLYVRVTICVQLPVKYTFS